MALIYTFIVQQLLKYTIDPIKGYWMQSLTSGVYFSPSSQFSSSFSCSTSLTSKWSSRTYTSSAEKPKTTFSALSSNNQCMMRSTKQDSSRSGKKPKQEGKWRRQWSVSRISFTSTNDCSFCKTQTIYYSKSTNLKHWGCWRIRGGSMLWMTTKTRTSETSFCTFWRETRPIRSNIKKKIT